MHRTAYIAVEAGRRPGSAELFARCAALLTEHLGQAVEADDLMVKEDRTQDRGSSAEGPRANAAQAQTDAQATASAAATEETDALSRGLA
jgi:hypothetical protein